MCFDVKKSNRCYQFQHCRECSSTSPAATIEAQPVRGAEDAAAWAGGRGAFQPSVDSCAIGVFHLLLQKCASAEYCWLCCEYPLQSWLCKQTQVLTKAAFWEALTAHPLSALKLGVGGSKWMLTSGPQSILYFTDAQRCIKSALLSFLGMAQIAQVLQRKQVKANTQTHFRYFFLFFLS